MPKHSAVCADKVDFHAWGPPRGIESAYVPSLFTTLPGCSPGQCDAVERHEEVRRKSIPRSPGQFEKLRRESLFPEARISGQNKSEDLAEFSRWP